MSGLQDGLALFQHRKDVTVILQESAPGAGPRVKGDE